MRTAIADRVTGRQAALAGFTLANVCGGPATPIGFTLEVADLVLPAPSPTLADVHQGERIGTVDPKGASVPLTLDLASMIDSNGKTLASLLADTPATINTTLMFPLNIVDFPPLNIVPEPAIVAASPDPAVTFFIVGASLLVNGNSCSLTMVVRAIFPD